MAFPKAALVVALVKPPHGARDVHDYFGGQRVP